ncbi:hypothetical protein SBRCBS47491_000333 [Sporothrix bragantina]|uniref:Carboxylesterase family protein n=1 Tax=Sporothrix bragantina TaxID=671064 RepID=A0ABP0APG1_9PEZI
MIDTILLPGTPAPPPYAVDMLATGLNSVSPKPPMVSVDPIPLDRSQSLPRSPSSSVARIEDTLEELDRLEDQFEAVHRLVRVNRVASPDKEVNGRKPSQAPANGTKQPVSKNGTLRSRPTDLTRTASTRRSTGTADPAKKASDAAVSTGAPGTKRLSVARPLSLLPPKPPVKSSKPLTTSTFELPGEAVARRLKEQREARMQAAAASAAVPSVKSTPTNAGQLRRARSVKPPTIPTFELPGEAISRRKREEHEAKIKQQEEEERKRREFKARPIRLSITPSTAPRETLSSRARTNRASINGEGAITGGRLSVPGSAPQANRRLSSLSAPSSASNNTAGQSQVPRGRDTTLEPSSSANGHISRATSTSTGSISGKRSTISMEDVQNQKLRGREILHRDSVLSSDRDREKRERETIAKQARQQAAERSRALSREWAEKQKLKAKKAAPVRAEN